MTDQEKLVLRRAREYNVAVRMSWLRIGEGSNGKCNESIVWAAIRRANDAQIALLDAVSDLERER